MHYEHPNTIFSISMTLNVLLRSGIVKQHKNSNFLHMDRYIKFYSNNALSMLFIVILIVLIMMKVFSIQSLTNTSDD